LRSQIVSRKVPSSLNTSLATSQAQIRPLKWPTSSKMCLRSSARSSAGEKASSVSQDGFWLCHTRVCPRTVWPCARAKSISSSAGAQL
jgi:hypothetical protein